MKVSELRGVDVPVPPKNPRGDWDRDADVIVEGCLIELHTLLESAKDRRRYGFENPSNGYALAEYVIRSTKTTIRRLNTALAHLRAETR